MKLTDLLKNSLIVLDGGMGTLLQAAGLAPGEAPEGWCLSHPDEVRAIHRAYYEAGSNVVSTNTFGANLLHYTKEQLAEIIPAAVRLCREAAALTASDTPRFVALDVGPTGKLLAPFGDLDFEEAVAIFAESIRIGVEAGVDLILIETMNDSYETRAALLAAKENSTLPVFVTNAYGADGKLMTGATPEAMVAMLEGMGADAIGANCSLGPDKLAPVIREMLATASTPIILKPNAGLPISRNGKTEYDVTPVAFAEQVSALVREGVRIVGGCCGTTPQHIQETANAVRELSPVPVPSRARTVISSYARAVCFDTAPILIGERINPTGKPRFKQALRDGDVGYILKEGLSEEEHGADVLDVNVGLPEINESEMLCRAVCELQAVTALPLQIDTANPEAMARALRRYNGKAMVNSVNGKEESLSAILPLVKKYGGVVVALTLDDSGIPNTVDGRVAIAERILAAADAYGVRRSDIIFDPLAMAVSADPRAAEVTLATVARLTKMGCRTSLGVSNISFGLPARDAVNATFFAAALERGLSAAIMNPYSAEMMRVYHAHLALHGLDPNFSRYIAFADSLSEAAAASVSTGGPSSLSDAIVKGLGAEAGRLTAELLTHTPAMEVVQNEIIPALDTVGRGFENKTLYLPQLLMSAEAAGVAFERVKAAMPGKAAEADAFPVVLATVRGDIHDIGKNIVRLLLENYDFRVTDLGRDVPPERIVEEVKRRRVPLVGLSALMTTTVPAMEETIRQLREQAPFCRVMVGGAVLTEEYAAAIGADAYGKDAMAAVRYAEEVRGAHHPKI